MNASASEGPIRRVVGRDWDLTAEQCEALKARLMRNIDASAGPDGCWPWTAWTHGMGYGSTKIVIDGKKRGLNASRAMYVAEHGRISAEEVVRHSCDNPPCCNPRHLIAGTTLDNARDRVERGRQRRGADTARSIQISDETIAEIRAAYVPGSRHASQHALAARFGLNRSIIQNIVVRRGRWAEDVAA